MYGRKQPSEVGLALLEGAAVGEEIVRLRTGVAADPFAGFDAGRGEAAELAYLSLKECGLEPVAVFDQEAGHEFLGIPVLAIGDHAEVVYDLMIIATLDRPPQQLNALVRDGIPADKLFPLRRDLARRSPLEAGKTSGNGQPR